MKGSFFKLPLALRAGCTLPSATVVLLADLLLADFVEGLAGELAPVLARLGEDLFLLIFLLTGG
ncbi:hypothetical protein TUM4636_30210 [Shewanella glacialipiscicola]|nr:hypothetical protein TUM4636_30210 [Shewanella glacialipiscicola]